MNKKQNKYSFLLFKCMLFYAYFILTMFSKTFLKPHYFLFYKGNLKNIYKSTRKKIKRDNVEFLFEFGIINNAEKF